MRVDAKAKKGPPTQPAPQPQVALAGPRQTLLRLEADARLMGAACSDVYFQSLAISGHWTNSSGTLEFFAKAGRGPRRMPWTSFGRIDLKVVDGRTAEGIDYLNVFARHLGDAGYPVGGLLGGDSYAEAAAEDPRCKHTISLSRAQGKK